MLSIVTVNLVRCFDHKQVCQKSTEIGVREHLFQAHPNLDSIGHDHPPEEDEGNKGKDFDKNIRQEIDDAAICLFEG